MKQKSFTLIELMVVIAVIGLLAGLIFVSLSRARARARDARILLDMRQVRSIAALMYSDYGSYAQLCFNGTLNENAPDPYGDQLKALEDNITSQQPSGSLYIAHATATAYCVSVQLNSEDLYCMDFTGITRIDYMCMDAETGWLKSICWALPELPPP